MGLPETRTYDNLEQIKSTPGFENIPIIIFTGKSFSRTEEQRIKQYADSIVIKTAHSYQRILDEVSLFLHIMDQQQKNKPTNGLERLGSLDEVLKNKTVLLADDDVRNIFSLTKILEQHKMKIIPAIDGKEALEKMNAHPDVDIVLMDMMMPEMDGFESIRKIRQTPAFQKYSDHCDYSKSNDGRPGKMHTGRSIRLYFKTCRYGSTDFPAAHLVI